MGPLCDDGCEIVLTKTKLSVIKNNEVILCGTRNRSNDLWDIPIEKTKLDATNFKTLVVHPGLYTDIKKKKIPMKTKPVEKNSPCTPSNLKKSLCAKINNVRNQPNVEETLRAHCQKTCRGRNTGTTHESKPVTTEEEIYPAEDKGASTEFFCFAALAKEFNNTIYSNATKKILVSSFRGHKYVMIIRIMMLTRY